MTSVMGCDATQASSCTRELCSPSSYVSCQRRRNSSCLANLPFFLMIYLQIAIWHQYRLERDALPLHLNDLADSRDPDGEVVYHGFTHGRLYPVVACHHDTEFCERIANRLASGTCQDRAPVRRDQHGFGTLNHDLHAGPDAAAEVAG